MLSQTLAFTENYGNIIIASIFIAIPKSEHNSHPSEFLLSISHTIFSHFMDDFFLFTFFSLSCLSFFVCYIATLFACTLDVIAERTFSQSKQENGWQPLFQRIKYGDAFITLKIGYCCDFKYKSYSMNCKHIIEL